MNINPESIDVFKTILTNPSAHGFSFKSFRDCFEKSETVTAKHILFQQYLDYIQKPLPKLVGYILMDQLLGLGDGKDENGNLGYYLKLNTTASTVDESSHPTSIPWPNSSNVSLTEYDIPSSLLKVTFKNGNTYCYEGIDSVVWKQLATCESIGSFIAKNIVKKYKSVKL